MVTCPDCKRRLEEVGTRDIRDVFRLGNQAHDSMGHASYFYANGRIALCIADKVVPGVVMAECAQGTGRLEGHICEARHFYVPATPGRADARWESAEAGCSHLAINVAVFASVDEAEAAVDADALLG